MNATINKVLELESRFEKYNDCKISATIKVPYKEMRDAAHYLGGKTDIHVFYPFESFPDQSYYMFLYKSERHKELTISVESIEEFRLKKDIIEI